MAQNPQVSNLLPRSNLTSDNAMRMHYNLRVFKTVRESDWSADHIAAHGVTLDEVAGPSLSTPTGLSPDGRGRH
jgi:hypothetical protein